MPKMKKEKSDEILKLLDEGYTNVEIARKAHVSEGTVSRIRSRLKKDEKKNNEGAKKIEIPLVSVPLSMDALKKLGAIQTVLGCNTLDEAINLLYSDVPKIMAFKFKATLNFHGTPSEVFREVLEMSRMLSDATNPQNVNSELQAEILAKMGMTWFPKGLYDLEGENETLVQFIERSLLESYEEKGWTFNKKTRRQVINMDPFIEDEIDGDLVSIYCPITKSWSLPKEEDDYFGVKTLPISEKLAWINIMKTGVKGSTLLNWPPNNKMVIR